MPGVCKLGDTGMGGCLHSSHAPTLPFPYVTVFASSAVTVMTNALGTVRVGDAGISSCGHPTVALLGSPTVMSEKLPTHRVADTGANFGPYVADLGSVNVIAN